MIASRKRQQLYEVSDDSFSYDHAVDHNSQASASLASDDFIGGIQSCDSITTICEQSHNGMSDKITEIAYRHEVLRNF